MSKRHHEADDGPSSAKKHRVENEDEVADIVGDFNDDDDDVQPVIDALIGAGVGDQKAKLKAKDMANPDETTFMELYGRGAIVREANGSRRDLNVAGLGALDIRTSKPDGSTWDFTKRSDRRDAMEMVDKLAPDFIVDRRHALHSVHGMST